MSTPLPDGERDGAFWLPPVMDVRRLLMLIFEGRDLKTNVRRGAAFALV